MSEVARRCSVCEGEGCDECGSSGRRVRTVIDAGDGIKLSVSGDRPLGAAAQEALAELARVAFARLRAAGSE